MERHTHARAETEWQQALELEKKLKAASRKRGFWDAEAKALRKQLRGVYEGLLFTEPAFAAANDVEGQLWKGCFYLPIEEFRSRMRQAEKAGAPAAATLSKVASAFLKFLEDAAVFYKRLAMHLQSVYGDVNVRLELPPGVPATRPLAAAADAADGMQCSTSSSAARDVRTSVHRCLVFLGDLARYASQAAPKAAMPGDGASNGSPAAAGPGRHVASRADWARATAYYRLAAHVLPRSGNPHNQLAVMAFWSGDELKAAYHYARSLCVRAPFTTAHENLLQLLQNNRTRYAQLCQTREQQAREQQAQAPEQQQQQQQAHARRPVLPMQQQLAELSVCYVRLCGLLYDRINQHEYSRTAKDAFEALTAWLDHPQYLALLQRQRLYDCTPLHLIVLAIFTAHSSSSGGGTGGSAHHHSAAAHHHGDGQSSAGGDDGGPMVLRTYAGSTAAAGPGAGGGHSTHQDSAQRALQRSRCLATTLRTGRLLAQAASIAVRAKVRAAEGAGADDGIAAAAAAGKTGATSLLVGLNVLLQWLAAQPQFAVVAPGAATEEEAKARSKFWAAGAQLLRGLAPAITAAAGGGAAAAGAAPPPSPGFGGMRAAFMPAAAAGGGGSGSVDAGADGGALPEELELLGFEPLRSKHYWHVTDVGKAAVDESGTRIRRMLAAARVVSASLAAEHQQQLLRPASSVRGSSSAASAQVLSQLRAAEQQFIESVAATSGAAVAAQRQQQQQQQQQQQRVARPERRDSAASMDVDGGGLQAPPPQQQQAGSGGLAPAAAAATGRTEGDEEVIVFRPRARRLTTSPAPEGAPGPPAAAAAVADGARSPGTRAALAAAAAAGTAAEPPPLPQMLLSGRQHGALSSPASRSPVVQQPAAAAALPGAAGAHATSAGLLQGHAATALDLQQAQAASDLLLARLTARQPAAAAAAGAFGSFGAGNAIQQQQQDGAFWQPGGAGGGSEHTAAPAAGVSAALAAVQAALAASAALPEASMGLQLQGFTDPFAGFGGLGLPPGDTPGLSVVARPTAGGFAQQPGVVGAFTRPVGIQQPWQQQGAAAEQGLAGSYSAAQMEATATDAANRVLSPDVHEGTGLALLQQHQQHQQQQQFAADGMIVSGSGRASLHSRGGSWMSGSAASTPRAEGVGGASQQQQDQLQVAMAHRRLSAGSGSPAPGGHAVGAERGATTPRHQHAQGAAGAMFARPSRSSSPAVIPGGDLQPGSNMGAMFAGPHLFGGGGAAAVADVTAAMGAQHRRGSSGSGVAAAGGPGSGLLPPPAPVLRSVSDNAAGLLPSVLDDVLGVAPDECGGQQQQYGGGPPAVARDSPDPGGDGGGLTLLEFLAAQQRKAANGTGASVLLRPLDLG